MEKQRGMFIMNRIVIIGAGGFGREVEWLLERMNQKKTAWEFMGYIDDGIEKGTLIGGYRVIGCVEDLLSWKEHLFVVCAVGSPKVREKICRKVSENPNLVFPNLVDPSVIGSDRIRLGQGNIICAGTILTVDIEIGDFNIINLACTVGHDCRILSFVTVYPNVSVSGNVLLGDFSEIGTGAQIIQGITVGRETVIGAGAVVVRDITVPGTYAGIPARRLKPSIQEEKK